MRTQMLVYGACIQQLVYLHPGGYCPDWGCQQHVATTSKSSHKQGASHANIFRLGLLLCLQPGYGHLSEARVQVKVDTLTDSSAQ